MLTSLRLRGLNNSSPQNDESKIPETPENMPDRNPNPKGNHNRIPGSNNHQRIIELNYKGVRKDLKLAAKTNTVLCNA